MCHLTAKPSKRLQVVLGKLNGSVPPSTAAKSLNTVGKRRMPLIENLLTSEKETK